LSELVGREGQPGMLTRQTGTVQARLEHSGLPRGRQPVARRCADPRR
jgi:hypothetical protein